MDFYVWQQHQNKQMWWFDPFAQIWIARKSSEHSKFYFNGNELKKKNIKWKSPRNYDKTDKPTTDITEKNPKMLAKIKTVARFHPFVLSPSIILMLYSAKIRVFLSQNLCISRAELNHTEQVELLYRASSELFIQNLEQKFSCPLYVDSKTIQDTWIINIHSQT